MTAMNMRYDDDLGSWNDDKVRKFIRLRSEHENEFRNSGIRNVTIWRKIGNLLGVTATQCENKWKYLKAKYTKIKDIAKTTGASSKLWKFENDMDSTLRGRPNITPVAISSNDEPSSFLEEGDDPDDLLDDFPDDFPDNETGRVCKKTCLKNSLMKLFFSNYF